MYIFYILMFQFKIISIKILSKNINIYIGRATKNATNFSI